MDDSSSKADGTWVDILQLTGRSCPACGKDAARPGSACECGHVALAASEEEEARVDVVDVVTGRAHDPRKIPLEKAGNLFRLREACAGAIDGTISLETYQELVSEVYRVATMGCKALNSDVVKKRAETLSPQELEVGKAMAACFDNLKEATGQMLAYVKSRNISDAEAGLKLAESTFVAISETQDRALEIVDRQS